MAVEFTCRRCGACCRWPGYVRLTPEDTGRAAACLGMTVEAFTREYTALTADRRNLTLTESAAGVCVMLTEDGNGGSVCRIQQGKPRQCRDFPLRWNFDGWEKECPGASSLKDKGSYHDQ